MSGEILTARTDIRVRFSEVDMMGVVWHGNYVRYFEDGREAFCKKYELNYLDALDEGLASPVVKMDVNYKKSLRYNEPAYIDTVFKNSDAAKIEYEYRIYKQETSELITVGHTMQVFLDKRGELMLTTPPSFIAWKKRWGVIE